MVIPRPRAEVAARSLRDFQRPQNLQVLFIAVWSWRRRPRKCSASSEAPAGKLSTLAADSESGSWIVISAKTSRSVRASSWPGRDPRLLNTRIRSLGWADDAVRGRADVSRRSSVLLEVENLEDRAPVIRKDVGQGRN